MSIQRQSHFKPLPLETVITAVLDSGTAKSTSPIDPVLEIIWNNLALPSILLNPVPPEEREASAHHMVETFQAITVLCAFELLDADVFITLYDSAIIKMRTSESFTKLRAMRGISPELFEHTISEVRGMIVDATSPADVLPMRERLKAAFNDILSKATSA